MYVISVHGFVINLDKFAGIAKNVDTSSKLRIGCRNNPDIAFTILTTRKTATLSISSRCSESEIRICERMFSLKDAILN